MTLRLQQLIEEKLPALHRKEADIARVILEHPAAVTQWGITELAAKAGSSPATVTRLCRYFGLEGYADLKLKLAAELAQKQPASTYQDFVAENPLETIIAAMEANHIRSISDTTRMLDLKQLAAAIQALSTARRIHIYGMATSSIVAHDLMQKLLLVGIHAFASADPHLQITAAANLEPGDAALAISYSGETRETIEALHCAKQAGAATISLTQYGVNSLSRLADISLYVSTLEQGIRRGDMASRIAQLHVIDIMYTGLVSSRFNTYIPRMETSFTTVRAYRKKEGGIPLP